MMGFLADIAGAKGAGYGTGAATITAPGGKKIFAIGLLEASNITNLKYTPPKSGETVIPEKTVVLDWMAKALPAVGPAAYIPLGYDANEVTLASGSLIVFYR